jgi:GNAT superfamily N-acetyltransferase
MTDRSIPGGVTIRPIAPGDRPRLERFYAALSIDSLDARFHGATRGIGDREARSFCGPDHVHREGLVAVERRRGGRDRIVGHVCLEPIDDSGDLEMAIAVADAWQHHGIGRALLGAALDWATVHGVKRLHAAIRWSNPAIVGLLRSIDRPMHIANGADGDLEAVIDLAQPLPAAA